MGSACASLPWNGTACSQPTSRNRPRWSARECSRPRPPWSAVPWSREEARMPTLPSLLRASWLPGALVLAAAAGSALVVGLVLGARSWPPYLGLALGGLLLAGWVEQFWTPDRTPPPK